MISGYHACGECLRATAGDEALKFIRLEIKILELFALTGNLRTFVTARYITEIVNQYEKVLDEFENMKKLIQAPDNYRFWEETTSTQVTLYDELIR